MRVRVVREEHVRTRWCKAHIGPSPAKKGRTLAISPEPNCPSAERFPKSPLPRLCGGEGKGEGVSGAAPVFRPLLKHSRSLIAFVAAFAILAGLDTAAVADQPVPVIFDTDISGDVDDVLALALLHALADRGECSIEAITISKINPLTGKFADAVNTFYGRPDIPIGVTRDAQRRNSRYLSLVNEREAGAFRYPHDVEANETLPDAVTVLRKTLAEAQDNSVAIVQVGLATNLADLAWSPADDISPLSGKELIRQKIKVASVMAGAFVPIGDNDHFLEANVRNGIDSMQRFAEAWPAEVPVLWSGYSIGIATRYPRESIARDFDYRKHHIVREAYLRHSGPDHDRPSWDLTSVLHAVRPADAYFGISRPGRVTVEDDGFTRFEGKPNGRDRYLKINRQQATRVIATLRTLVSQPPR